MTDNQAIDGAPRDASNFKLCPRCANIGRSDDCTECQGRVAWYSKPPNEAFTEWYCRNPYEELTNSTAAWMAFKAGRDHASVVVQSSMTTNQTIDGVPRELLERLLTDACNENWSDLNALLHSPPACRCKRYGKGNPHWPCPVHASPPAQHQVEPTEEMKEAGCQAYMDADGMIGIMHRSSMGHAYRAMRALEQPAPVADPFAKGFTTLESDGGKYKIVTSFATRDDAWSAYRALVGAKPAPVAVVLPPKLKSPAFKTVDRGSVNYAAGWNAYANELKRLNHSL